MYALENKLGVVDFALLAQNVHQAQRITRNSSVVLGGSFNDALKDLDGEVEPAELRQDLSSLLVFDEWLCAVTYHGVTVVHGDLARHSRTAEARGHAGHGGAAFIVTFAERNTQRSGDRRERLFVEIVAREDRVLTVSVQRAVQHGAGVFQIIDRRAHHRLQFAQSSIGDRRGGTIRAQTKDQRILFKRARVIEVR
ncbi:MAG: hypothetical protein GIX03_02365 [Candidatus Eremiobacteraeota bacterium]|nr:hypothetical protein [Candidatus Eremiobacteraeota bacterium]